MAIFIMIPEDDRHLKANLNEFLRTNKPEQQSKKIWIPTPENPGRPEDHTPIQTRIVRESINLK